MSRLSCLVGVAWQMGLRRFLRIVEAVGFWVAVGVPLLYVPAILLYGDGRLPFETLAVLAGVNLAGLVVGHRYNRSMSGSTDRPVGTHGPADTRREDA